MFDELAPEWVTRSDECTDEETFGSRDRRGLENPKVLPRALQSEKYFYYVNAKTFHSYPFRRWRSLESSKVYK